PRRSMLSRWSSISRISPENGRRGRAGIQGQQRERDMATTKIYQALAEAFVAEGAKMQFGLLGDGNMHWATAMEAEYGVDTIHVRHEHCAVGAAMGYHSATGEVGIASVTCGPGFTQTMTALTSAARGNVPLVCFAG